MWFINHSTHCASAWTSWIELFDCFLASEVCGWKIWSKERIIPSWKRPCHCLAYLCRFVSTLDSRISKSFKFQADEVIIWIDSWTWIGILSKYDDISTWKRSVKVNMNKIIFTDLKCPAYALPQRSRLPTSKTTRRFWVWFNTSTFETKGRLRPVSTMEVKSLIRWPFLTAETFHVKC
jgi:hypothetical protein